MTFCVIIAWAIPCDVKKVFVIVGLVSVGSMADARLSKIAQIALILWLQEKIMYVKCEGDLFRNFYTI